MFTWMHPWHTLTSPAFVFQVGITPSLRKTLTFQTSNKPACEDNDSTDIDSEVQRKWAEIYMLELTIYEKFPSGWWWVRDTSQIFMLNNKAKINYLIKGFSTCFLSYNIITIMCKCNTHTHTWTHPYTRWCWMAGWAGTYSFPPEDCPVNALTGHNW